MENHNLKILFSENTLILMSFPDFQLWCFSIHFNCSQCHLALYLCPLCAGAVIHWFFLSAQIWWLFHVSTLFYKVVRPSVTLKEQKWSKWIHIILSIIGWYMIVYLVCAWLLSLVYNYGYLCKRIVYYKGFLLALSHILLAVFSSNTLSCLFYSILYMFKNDFVEIKRMYRDGTGLHIYKVAMIAQHHSHITIST